jgi:AcrR family transcriptional regulator
MGAAKNSTAKTPKDKRSRLVQTAVKLTHRQGFRKTTLADIAIEANVPLGNVYYYFKTKDEIVDAILQQRQSELQSSQARFEQIDSPRDRLLAFVEMTIDNRKMLAQNGCPIGTLCTELQKEGGDSAKKAGPLLAEPLAWIEVQFRALGKGREAAGLALHLLSALQGVSLLAHTLRDPELVVVEGARLKEWVRGIRVSIGKWRSVK